VTNEVIKKGAWRERTIEEATVAPSSEQSEKSKATNEVETNINQNRSSKKYRRPIIITLLEVRQI